MELVNLKKIINYLDINQIKHIYSNLGKNDFSNHDHFLENQLYSDIINKGILNQYILYLDDASLDIIDEVSTNSYLIIKDNNPLINHYHGLAEYGLLFKITIDNTDYYTIAQEIYDMIRSNIDKIKKEAEINKLVIKFARAAVSYYGLLNNDDIKVLYNYYHSYRIVDILPQLHFYSKFQTVFTYDGSYLYDNNIRDINEFLRDKNHFKNLPIYIYPHDLFYVDERFVSIDVDVDFYYEMSDYFTNVIQCDSSLIVAIYYFLMYEYDIKTLIEVIKKETIVDTNKFDQRFEYYVNTLYQSVRCWVLKGHKVSEVNDKVLQSPNLYIESQFVLLKKPESTKKKRGFIFNKK